MLKIAEFGNEPYLLVGAKDYLVHCLSLSSQNTMDFQAKEPVRWVDGASDYIYGVERNGYKIFVWSIDTPTQPILIWRAPDKIQDICIVKENAG
jgi:hypothetical protein